MIYFIYLLLILQKIYGIQKHNIIKFYLDKYPLLGVADNVKDDILFNSIFVRQ